MNNFERKDAFETVKEIMKYYYSLAKDDYIPGIINEGNLFAEGKELYVKIIMVKRGKVINNTWMKENLSKDNDKEVINLIVRYNYNHEKIYGLSPFLLTNDNISFVEQEKYDVLNMVIDEYDNRINNKRILYMNNKNIMFYLPLINDYIISPFSRDDEYDLYAEIEYRVYNDTINPEKQDKFGEENTFIDLICREEKAYPSDKMSKLYWLRATTKIDLNELSKSKKSTLDIKVVDLSSGKIRELNSSNYNDDTNAGLIVFSKDAADIIKEYYYFYDLVLKPKIERVSESLVDYYEDIIVFWEGEFNSNLPLELKMRLQKYNITNKTDHLLSPAMYNWQLMAHWEIYDDLLPNQKLARIVAKHNFGLAKEYNLDFYPPRDINEYSNFVKSILKFFKYKISDLKLKEEYERKIKDIIEKKDIFDDLKDMTNNYYGLCLYLSRKIGYEEK